MCKGSLYSGNYKLEGHTRVQKAVKLDPRAEDEEAVRDVREALMGIFIGRQRKREYGNLQGPGDDENGGSGTGSYFFSLLDLTFILLPFAHVLLFPCLFSV